MKIYRDLFGGIIAVENLFGAWETFKADKKNKTDVAEFERHLETNLFQLHRDLKSKSYRHGPYRSFYIHDPKQRHIHKATVRDRVLHHAVFSVLNPIFEETFTPTSFSCRAGFGTHKGVDVLERKARAVARNGTSQCFVLKCDVRKFFDSVDHDVLLAILGKRIKDKNAMWLLRKIVGSYPAAPVRERENKPAHEGTKGIPIGNLTSQLFANVYMNEFDQFVKHGLRVKHYARYTDDFAIASPDEAYLENLIAPIAQFLRDRLALTLHPNKVSVRKLHHGVDFLGYVFFGKHRLVRTKTRRRMFKKFKMRIAAFRAGAISENTLSASLSSYLGVLSHADAHRLSEEMENLVWFLDG